MWREVIKKMEQDFIANFEGGLLRGHYHNVLSNSNYARGMLRKLISFYCQFH